MQAVLVYAPRKLKIEEIPIPDPDPGDVVIRVRAALTCGTDLKLYERGHPKISFPTFLGHEFAGEIFKIGDEVKGFKIGERVVATPTAPCGRCVFCLMGRENLCENLFQKAAFGAFAEYLKIPKRIVEKNLFLIPEEVSYEEAAFLDPLASVLHGFKKLSLKREESLLVVGAGPIGLLFVALGKEMGIKDVFIVAKGDDRKEKAKELGGIVMNPDEIEKRFPEGPSPHAVVEATGRKDVWETTLKISGKGGKILLFGGLQEGSSVTFDATRLHYDEITLMGSFHYTSKDVKEAKSLIFEKRLPLKSLISGEFPLREIVKVFQLLKKGKGIKYVIRP